MIVCFQHDSKTSFLSTVWVPNEHTITQKVIVTHAAENGIPIYRVAKTSAIMSTKMLEMLILAHPVFRNAVFVAAQKRNFYTEWI